MKFPKIYRFFTERRWWLPTVSLLLLLALFFGGLILIRNRVALDNLAQKRMELSRQVAVWEKTKEKFPGYRDAHFTLAILYYQLGEREIARENLDRALEIDPNFEGGRELERKLKIDPPAGEAGN